MRTFYRSGDASQPFSRPAVYLDHWAVRKFASTPGIQDRLVSALSMKDGTYVLSPTNRIEFCAMTDGAQIADAERLLDRLLPRVFLTSDDLLKWESPDLPGQPPCDVFTAKMLLEKSQKKGNAVSFDNYLSIYQRHSARLLRRDEEHRARLIALLEGIRDDPTKRAVVKFNTVSGYASATRAYMAELIRDSVLDLKGKIPANDIDDWRHALCGLTWCDFVLLDGKWEQRVNSIQRRLDAENIPVKLPKCYSSRKDGVDRFLSDLEAFTAS